MSIRTASTPLSLSVSLTLVFLIFLFSLSWPYFHISFFGISHFFLFSLTWLYIDDCDYRLLLTARNWLDAGGFFAAAFFSSFASLFGGRGRWEVVLGYLTTLYLITIPCEYLFMTAPKSTNTNADE